MFEQFSAGYYLGRLAVEPHAGDKAVIQRATHERVNEQLYAAGEGVERLDHPLVMKVDGSHFPVHAAAGMPSATLGLPEALLERVGVRNPPTDRPVLLATAERAAQLLRLTGGERRGTDAEAGGDPGDATGI